MSVSSFLQKQGRPSNKQTSVMGAKQIDLRFLLCSPRLHSEYDITITPSRKRFRGISTYESCTVVTVLYEYTAGAAFFIATVKGKNCGEGEHRNICTKYIYICTVYLYLPGFERVHMGLYKANSLMEKCARCPVFHFSFRVCLQTAI